MAIIVKRTRDFKPAPAGLWPAVIIDVVEHPDVETAWGVKDKVELRFQLEESFLDENGNPRPWLVSRHYTANLNKNSHLLRDLESLFSRELTREEIAGFDAEQLIGKQCQVQIKHNKREETTYANVEAVLPPAKGQSVEAEPGYVRIQDREEREPWDE